MENDKLKIKLIDAVNKLNSEKNQYVLFSNGTFIVFDSMEYSIFDENEIYLTNKNIPIEQRSLKHMSLVSNENNTHLKDVNMDMAFEADNGWFVSSRKAGMFTFVLKDEIPSKEKNHLLIEEIAKKKLMLDRNDLKIIFIKDGLTEKVFY